MKISIITASYNYDKYIGETIQSVLDQTYSDWELIIIDDCSTDNSVEVIKSFDDKRINLYVNEKNIGLSKTIQKGLAKASGDWIVFLESDDLITPDYLEKKLEIINKYPDVNLIFNDCELFGDEDRVKQYDNSLKKTRTVLRTKKYPYNMFYNFYLSNKIFTFSSVMAKKNDLIQLNYNSDIDCLLDWHLWIQMAYLGNFYYIPDKLTLWRLHNKSYLDESTYKNPFNLQFKTYSNISKKSGNLMILIKVYMLHILWIMRFINKKIKKR